MELFTLNDFKVFDLDGFSERMAAIATRIRPKLASIGRALEPKISELVDVPLYVHVAKHARRTVNPRMTPGLRWAQIRADISKTSTSRLQFRGSASGFCLKQVPVLR